MKTKEIKTVNEEETTDEIMWWQEINKGIQSYIDNKIGNLAIVATACVLKYDKENKRTKKELIDRFTNYYLDKSSKRELDFNEEVLKAINKYK